MKPPTKRSWCWWSLVGYSVILIIAGFGIFLALAKTVTLPEDLALPEPARSPYDPYFFLGSILLMLLAPVAAVVLRWKPKEFFLAFAIATGFLTANLGIGFGLALCSAFVYLVCGKIAEVIAFYFSRSGER